MTELEQAIERHLVAYARAVRERDVEALVRLYDERVRVFDAWGTWSYEGLGAWRATVEQWFGSLGASRVEVRFEDVQTLAGAELAVVNAIVTYTASAANGAPLRAMQNRITWALEHDRGEWRIVHEHTSAPIDFDHRTAILRRESPRR